VQEVAPNVFVETGFQRVTVGAILTEAGYILVDTPPYPDEAQSWRDTLAEHCDRPVVAIVNTDCHRDRLLGNCWFDAQVIVAHEETINQVAQYPTTLADAAADLLAQPFFERSAVAGMRLRLPTVGFTQRMHLRYGETDVLLLAMPGPTAGSIWVHLPTERILFTGDSVLTEQHPYISSACTKEWLENLTALRRARFPADVIVPGRGGLTTKGATEVVSNYLRLARRRVYSLYRLGRPRSDTATLVPELLEMFPYREADSESIQRRIKIGLDRIYEEFRLNDKSGDGAKPH